MYTLNFKEPIHVYFMGIGGISMSGLAEILLREGFTISGSDMKESALTKQLEEKIEKKHAKILKFSKFKKREKRAYFASILTWSIN